MPSFFRDKNIVNFFSKYSESVWLRRTKTSCHISVNSVCFLLSASFYLACAFIPHRFPNSVDLNNWYQSEAKVLVGAMGLEEGKSKIEKFDGSDFAFWRSHIEDFLYQKDLYRSLLGKGKGRRRTNLMKTGRSLTEKQSDRFDCCLQKHH